MFSILYVDDEPGLLEVGKLFLEQGGQFSVDTIESAAQALTLLRARHYDAIISDYQMPVMDGIEFLKQVRASGNTIPFIIFTGRGREEIVIQALNEGADFYLQKGGEPLSQFAELAHKIRQAVQQRMAEAIIRDYERREADIIDFLPDATFAIDTKGVVIAWNRAMEKMAGVASSEILGKGDYAYAIPFYHERRPILIDLVLNNDPDTVARYPYIKHEGKTLFSEITIPHFNHGRGAALWFTASPLVDRQGTVVGAIESIREITDWKRAEAALNESERRFRELSDLLPQVVYEIDMDGNLKYANHIAFEIFGYTEDEFRQGLNVMQMIAPDDRERAATGIRAIGDGKGRTGRDTAEFQALRKDGSTFPVSIYSSPVVVNDRITGLRGIIVDITERKRAEDTIRESEQRYRNVVEDQTEFISRFLPDGTHVFVNEAYCRYFGLARDEILGHRFRPEIPAEDRERVKQFFESLTHDHPVDIIEHRIVMPGGSIRWQRWSDRAIFNPSGTVTEYQSVGRDVTDKKEAEIALQAGEARYRTLLTSVNEGIWVVDARAVTTYVNPIMAELLGYPVDEILGKTLFSYMDATWRAVAEKKFSERKDGIREQHEFRFLKKDGSYLTALLNTSPLSHADGSFAGAIATVIDIGKRKEAEEALRQSEERYRLIADNTADHIWIFDMDLTLKYTSPSVTKMKGLSVSEALSQSLEEMMTPASVESVLKRFHEEMALEETGTADPGRTITFETEEYCRDGSTILVENAVTLLRDPEGRPVSILGISRDITARKSAEKALRESEDRYRKLVEITPDAILVHQEGRVVYTNPAGLELLGAAHAGQIVGRPVLDFVHTDSRETVRTNIEKDLAGERTPFIELRMLRLDGETVTVEGQGVQTLFQGKPAIQVAIRDITEHKQAEEMIRLLSRKDREALRVARMGHFEFDVATQTFLFNDQYYAMAGMTADEAGGYRIPAQDFAKRFVYPDDAHVVEETIREAVNTHDPDFQKQFESRIVRPDGTVLWVGVWFRIEKDACGNTIRFYGVNQDITDRKQAEQELVNACQEYQSLLDQIQDVYYRSDTDGRLIRTSRSMADLLGYRDASELLGKNIAEEFYLNPGDRTKLVEEITRKGKVTNYEVRLRRKDGTPVTISVSSHTWYHPDGTRGGVEGSFRDITEQKRAENALRESELLLREIFDNANDAVFLLERYPDAPGKYLMVNDKAVRMLGYSKEELLTMSPRDIVPEDIARKVMPAVIQKLLRDGHATFESAHRRKDGSIYPIEVSTHTFRYGGKDVDLSIVRDITERKRSERIIQETSKKINLLSSITRHDVANQVSILKGYAKIALEKKPDPVVADFLSKIDTAGSTIARQVEFTREYQELGMHAPGWHRIREIIAHQKTPGISLSCTCDAEIFADPMIEKVFFNLFDNVTRHGKRVTAISAGCERVPDGGLVIVVEDNGVGIPLNDKERIFEKGFGKHTGYGLFLVREILAITGITIRETGNPGDGARFEITVPKDGYRSVS